MGSDTEGHGGLKGSRGQYRVLSWMGGECVAAVAVSSLLASLDLVRLRWARRAVRTTPLHTHTHKAPPVVLAQTRACGRGRVFPLCASFALMHPSLSPAPAA